MDKLSIAGTEDTPTVLLDKDAGVFEISGRSLPEDAAEFYAPILQWLEDYASAANGNTDFEMKLEYFNTASSKLLLDVLTKLEDIDNSKVIWYFHDDDEDMEEAGEEFEEIIEDVEFELRAIEE